MSGNVSAHLHELYDQHGELTPAIVVQAAAPPEHPLHNRFEWNDEKAGHAHRIDQARGLIRSVRIEFRAPDGARRTAREFLSVARPEGRTYQPTQEVAVDPVARAIVAADYQREWRMLRSRWGHLEGFLDMVAADLHREAS